MGQYYHEENFGYLVVKTFHKKCYGFNLKPANECATAKKIIQDVNNFIVNGRITNHGMTSLMKIAVERRVKKMIMRKRIVTMMTKRITITKKKRKGKRTRRRKMRRTRRRKMRRKRRRKRKRKKWRRNWIIKMMVTLRFQQSKVTMIVILSVLGK